MRQNLTYPLLSMRNSVNLYFSCRVNMAGKPKAMEAEWSAGRR
ncbi:hypothetical protein [Bacteroides caecimuris]|nr:hypothetical protein [Bacteroides caecimuris]